MSDRPAFRADIQGLRAIAVGSVVLFHAFPSAVPGGFVGVDVFFVISGYLITKIIVREIDKQKFSIANFYRRRVRRIFPALLLVCAACFAAGSYLLSPGQFAELGRNLVSTSLFLANVDFWHSSGYFDGLASVKPLLHMWSLAVEEQFYIFFPPLIVLLRRLGSWRVVAATLVGLLLCSLFVSELLVRRAPNTAYYLMPSRAYELLIGGIVAIGVVPAPSRQLWRNATSILGLICILVSSFGFTERLPFPGILALLPCIGTAAVIHAGQVAPTAGGLMISGRPFRLVGDLSYSLYLWHWPVLAFTRTALASQLAARTAALAVGFAFVAALLTTKYVERPFLRKDFPRLPYLVIAVATIMVTSAVGTFTYAHKGFASRFTASARSQFAASSDFNRRRVECHDAGNRERPYDAYCVYGTNTPPDVVVWGDSHGAEVVVPLGERAEEFGRSVRQITSSACPPARGYSSPERPRCADHNEAVLMSIVDDDAVRVVVLLVNQAHYSNTAALKRGYEATVRALLEAKKDVVIIQPIPTMPVEPPSAVGMAVQHGRNPGLLGVPRRSFDAATSEWRSFLEGFRLTPHVSIFDPASVLCNESVCRMFDNDIGTLYWNHDHLGVSGARYAFKPLLLRLYPSQQRDQ